MAYKPKEIEKFKETILQEIPLGKSLAKILKANSMCDYLLVYKWLNSESNKYDQSFAIDYARAREAQADFYSDDIIDISDEEEDAAKARVRIDARKWKAGKMKPTVYGDKIDITSGNKPIKPSLDLTKDQMDKLIDKL